MFEYGVPTWFIILIVLLVIGAGAGIWWYMNRDDEDEYEEDLDLEDDIDFEVAAPTLSVPAVPAVPTPAAPAVPAVPTPPEAATIDTAVPPQQVEGYMSQVAIDTMNQKAIKRVNLRKRKDSKKPRVSFQDLASMGLEHQTWRETMLNDE